MAPPGPLRVLADLLIRGPDAPFVLAELEDAFERDVERGIPRWRAIWRYGINTLASALNLWGSTARLRLPMALGTSWLDVRLGLRMLARQPVLTLVAVFALAIGIPASMLPMHVISVMAAPLPFDEGDRIVGIQNRNVMENRMVDRALHDYFIWRDELTSVEALGAARSDPFNVISEDGRAAPVRGSEITASAFEIVRVRPILGRTLLESDEVKGAPDVVVVSHEVWQSRLGADPDVVGSTIRIGTVPHEVVGVMPEGFMFPVRDLLWLPLRDRPTDFERGMGPDIIVFGRLADGVSIEEAQTELETVGARMASEFPETHEHLRPRVTGFTAMVAGVDPTSPELYLFQLIVLALLAIVCGNVGTLILARTATRSEEIAVRTALGASRMRIVSQLFVEALVLAAAATGVGLIIGDRVAAAFASRVFLEVPFWFDLGVNPRTVAMALGLAVFCATIAGVIPAFKATGRHVQRNLQRGRAGTGVRFGLGSSALIVAEVALAVGFLSVGGSLAGVLMVGTTVEDGVDRGDYLMGMLRVPWTDHNAVEDDVGVGAFAQEVARAHMGLARRLEAESGVRRFAMASRLPGMDHARRRVEVEGEDPTDGSEGHLVHTAVVDVGFFEGFGTTVLDGREFTTADLVGSVDRDRTAVIVNTAFVEHVLGGRNAVGRRFRYAVPDGEEPGPWYEVVGVVGHLGMNDLNPLRDEGVYHPGAPGEIHPLFVAADVGGDPESFTPALRKIVAEVDPDAMVQYPRSLDEAPNENRDVNRYGTALLLFLSGVAIVLSGAGLYALMSFTVSQRTREIGIRTALGATVGGIVRTIARRAFLQLLVGVALGAATGAWLLDLMVDRANLNLHVDPPVLVATFSVFMMVVGVMSCLGPTLRGLRIRPVEALKEQ